jgi:hypothetical protein
MPEIQRYDKDRGITVTSKIEQAAQAYVRIWRWEGAVPCGDNVKRILQPGAA